MNRLQSPNLDRRYRFWRRVHGALPPGVVDVITKWSCDFDNSPYIQLWIGYNHQIGAVFTHFGEESIGVLLTGVTAVVIIWSHDRYISISPILNGLLYGH